MTIAISSPSTPAAARLIRRIDPLSDPRWLTFIDVAAHATVFHHPAWLELLGRSYRYEISALCVLDGEGGIVAGVPLARIESRLTGRRLVAIPFSDVCPPLFAPGAPGSAAPALGRALAEERARTGLDIEVRAGIDGIPGGHPVPRFLWHRLPLEPDAAAVLARASKSQVRRGVAKARREGVVVERETGRDGLEAFYRLHLRTRRRQGVPTQPKSFILAFEDLFARGLGHVLVARHEGRAIAAAVFLSHRGTLTYKYGASDERFLGVRPNHLLFAVAIEAACEEGLSELDFGRTDPDNAGLATFKRSWGAAEEELAYTYVADRVPEDGAGRARRLMAGAIRRGPAFTGRAIGAALYRHAG
jgi:CelD/BcsL family acetyltransferase involved in cellulose biosynthesis